MNVKLHVRPDFLASAQAAADTLLAAEQEQAAEIEEMEDYFVAIAGFLPPDGYEKMFCFSHKKRTFVVYLDTRLD